MSRERDIRNAIKAALENTKAFDEVILGRSSDQYTPSSIESLTCTIEPLTQKATYMWDQAAIDSSVIDATLKLTFTARYEDQQLRDEKLEQVINFAYNALWAGNWLGLTMPAFTGFTGPARWLPPVHPERRAESTYVFRYGFTPGGSFDTSD